MNVERPPASVGGHRRVHGRTTYLTAHTRVWIIRDMETSTVLTITPIERHAQCGDLIEYHEAWDDDAEPYGDYRYNPDGSIAFEPVCKSCGPVDPTAVTVS